MVLFTRKKCVKKIKLGVKKDCLHAIYFVFFFTSHRKMSFFTKLSAHIEYCNVCKKFRSEFLKIFKIFVSVMGAYAPCAKLNFSLF
jgi:hypothetical protein